MDGLKGMQRGHENAVRDKVAPIKKMIGPYAPAAPRYVKRQSDPKQLVAVAGTSFVLGAVVAIYLASIYVRYFQG